jgi:hypothetical protein
MERRLDNSSRRDVPHDVARWRRSVLIRAGFDSELAQALGRDARIDLHGLLELVDRGARPRSRRASALRCER